MNNLRTAPGAVIEAPLANTYRAIKNRLAIPVPAEKISSKTIQGHRIDFINITDYKDLLDERAGVWEALIIDTKQIGQNLCCVVRISIHAADGIFSQDGTGLELVEINGYGDPFSNAYAQAFRRACESHGLSRELWRNPVQERKQTAAGTSKAGNGWGKPQKPEHGRSDAAHAPATSAQLALLNRKISEHGLDPVQHVSSIFADVTDVQQLSKSAASFLIDQLMN